MKGLFISEITAEMFRNCSLEGIEALMEVGEIYDIEYSRWIPYSERLPDETGVYIVTVRDKKIPEITGTRIDRWCLDDDKYRWIKYENPYGDNEYEIVAWMPLPRPYKEVEDEGNN